MSFKSEYKKLLEKDIDRIIRMAHEDRTSFENINKQYNLTHGEVIKFMRKNLDLKSFKRWRKRTLEKAPLKHEKLRGFNQSRFKSKAQKGY